MPWIETGVLITQKIEGSVKPIRSFLPVKSSDPIIGAITPYLLKPYVITAVLEYSKAGTSFPFVPNILKLYPDYNGLGANACSFSVGKRNNATYSRMNTVVNVPYMDVSGTVDNIKFSIKADSFYCGYSDNIAGKTKASYLNVISSKKFKK